MAGDVTRIGNLEIYENVERLDYFGGLNVDGKTIIRAGIAQSV
jgi:hypothetical protein